MIPLYIKYMGVEAYGLVGFFAMLQAWFTLLDMGLTPTVARESARFRGGATDAISYRRLIRALEGVFFIVALIGGGALLIASGYIAGSWLKVSQLTMAEVTTAVQLMAVIIAMRWMCGLYRGTVSGSERLVWLGGYNSLIATIRFVGVFPVLILVGATPTIFFSFQLCVAVLELAGLWVYSCRLMPIIPVDKLTAWTLTPLKPVIKFSLTIAFTSSVWVLVTQTDKLVLSKLLPLADYGYFMLAVLVAGGVLAISDPVSGAVTPRMAKLEAEGNHNELIRIYRQSTQLVCIIASAASVILVFFGEPLLWSWTGDKVLAGRCASILAFYACGNGILVISAFPYYLQYAKGDMRFNLIGSIGFVLFLIPAVIWAAGKYGGIGAGYVWLTANVIYFLFWVSFVHHQLEPGLNRFWYWQDVLAIGTVCSVVGWGLSLVKIPIANRWLMFTEITIMGLLVMLAGAFASSAVWERAKLWLSGQPIKQERPV